MSLTERRKFPRFPFHSRGTLQIGGHLYRGTLLDISLGGALFSGVDMRPIDQLGQKCQLNVLHGARPSVLAFDGSIVHTDYDRVGIEFQQLSEEATRGLKLIIDLNLGTAQMLNRDISSLLK